MTFLRRFLAGFGLRACRRLLVFFLVRFLVRFLVILLVLLWTSLPLRALDAPSASKKGVKEGTIVFLAASLQPVLLDIEKRHGLSLKLVPASSGLLARQIAAGAPADLYLTADTKWTTWLRRRHVRLLASKTFLSNRLALVEPRAVSTASHEEKILSAAETRARLVSATRIAIGDPSHVPVGLYAQQVLVSLSLDKPAFLAKLVPLVNTRATVLHVERGEVPLGIVYRSDALWAKRAQSQLRAECTSKCAKMRIVGYLPSDLHAPIAYDMLLLSEKGRGLYAFLSDAAAREDFFRFGFAPL